MKALSQGGASAAAAVLVSALLAACGGGGPVTVSSAGATNARFSQVMVITFNGQGLDKGVELKLDGPCTNLTRISGDTSTALQYSCQVSGVGRITSSLVDSGDGVTYGTLRVDIPLPRVSFTVSDGTRNGNLLLELDPAAAPASAGQFLAYVGAGFYTGTMFHRVRPDTGILGGGFVADAAGAVTARAATRPALALEKTGLKNLRGTIALYREQALDSANSMFFINTVDNPRFDVGSAETPDGYAVFGKLIEGLDVLDEIAKVPVRPDLVLGTNDTPVSTVRITAASQTR